MRILRPLLVLIVLAAPACARWESARALAPAAGPPGQMATGPAAPVADGPAVKGSDSGEPGIGQRPAAEPAQVPAAGRREAGPLATAAILAVIAAGAFAVFLLLAHVNC